MAGFVLAAVGYLPAESNIRARTEPMTDLPSTDPHDVRSDVPDPATWRTGEEPPTERQKAYLETLAREAGEELPDDITKAKASERIDDLRQATGRESQPVRNPQTT